MAEKAYIAIDLKSFYASCECVERGLDPLRTNLVVADASRTEKTICLAVSPSLKAFGIPGRPRLFEVVERVREVNFERRKKAPDRQFTEKSVFAEALAADPSLELDYIVAPPQMAHYMKISAQIFSIYMRWVSPEDIHVYSVDEVFIDATNYLATYRLSAREFAGKLIREVLRETGITATAGIGTNLYLAKVAMDIVAKHIPADEDGVRIAELDEQSYREKLWAHTPLTDFWRVGRGYRKRLEDKGLFTMGDIARCSLGGPRDYYNAELLYKIFGINAELLIDHAWGYEPCTIADIKAYKPESSSLSSGQVLPEPYTAEKGRLIVSEMTDLLSFDLVDKGLVTDQLVLTVCYDIANLKKAFGGEIKTDHYGRAAPKDAHGSINLGGFTSSTKALLDAVRALYDRIVDPKLLVRRMYVVANHVTSVAEAAEKEDAPEQLSLFVNYEEEEEKRRGAEEERQKELQMQEAILDIRKKFGKNAILKGMNYEDGATAKERNGMVGGHKA